MRVFLTFCCKKDAHGFVVVSNFLKSGFSTEKPAARDLSEVDQTLTL